LLALGGRKVWQQPFGDSDGAEQICFHGIAPGVVVDFADPRALSRLDSGIVDKQVSWRAVQLADQIFDGVFVGDIECMDPDRIV
jgi:hypothetical protein